MRTHCIALITGADAQTAARAWWETVARHWPVRDNPPRLEIIPPEAVLSTARSLRATSAWDAAVIAPDLTPPDTSVYRVIDVLQQGMVPTVLLQADPEHRLDEFHPGTVLVQPADADPRSTAAILFALAQRQPALRALEQSVRLAQSFQGETSAEIDRLHQELLLAAKVQRDFLPKHMPEIDGLGCSVLFRPASFVSGDTYDVSLLDEHTVGFFLADAMGHGVPAALMTLYIAGSLPRMEIDRGTHRIIPPAEALGRLNAELHDSIAGPTRFATAVCGTLDLRTGHFTLACAGHPAPLRVGPNGIRPVEVSGMLLGVVKDYEYEQVTIKLEEDEILVLHSDGVEAAFTPKHPDGTRAVMPPHFAPLSAMRRGAAMSSLPAAMESLAEQLDGQSGSMHQDDDLTVLAFQTTSVREPARRRREPGAAVGAVGGQAESVRPAV